MNFTIASACALQALPCRALRQLSAPRLIPSNNYVPGGISCAADLAAIFRHKISVSGAPSGKRLLSTPAHRPGGSRRFQRPARRGCRCAGKADPPQSAAGGTHRKKILRSTPPLHPTVLGQNRKAYVERGTLFIGWAASRFSGVPWAYRCPWWHQ